jgi:hypothetical protein
MIREKICPVCGAPLQCGPGTGADALSCWCQDLPPAMPLNSGAGCMCRKCLTQEIARRAEIRKQQGFL